MCSPCWPGLEHDSKSPVPSAASMAGPANEVDRTSVITLALPIVTVYVFVPVVIRSTLGLMVSVLNDMITYPVPSIER